MILGAHRSTAGGLWKAPESGRAIGCDGIQIFTRPPQRWAEKPLEPSEIDLFRQALVDYTIRSAVAHDLYLTNLASPNDDLRDKSIRSCITELKRCALLGIGQLVMHCGSHEGCDEQVGMDRFASGVQQSLDESEQDSVMILLETTAGQGKSLGWRFEQIAAFLEQIDRPQLTGVCLDTCHIFAAGYDLTTPESYAETTDTFDRIVGFQRLQCVHCNDSKKDLGSRVDRHENIGQGMMGDVPFRQLMNDKRLGNIPVLLETPDLETHEEDLRKLRSFLVTEWLGVLLQSPPIG